MSKNLKTSQSITNSKTTEKSDCSLSEDQKNNEFGLFSKEYRDMKSEKEISTKLDNKENKESSSNKDEKSDSTFSINVTNIINPPQASNKNEKEKKVEQKKRKKRKTRTKKKKIKKVKEEYIKKVKKEKIKEKKKKEKGESKKIEEKVKMKKNRKFLKKIAKSDKNPKKNNLKENEKNGNIIEDLSDEKVLNNFSNYENNNRRKKVTKPIEMEVELATTNNTTLIMANNEISNCVNLTDDNKIFDYQSEIPNEKENIIIFISLLSIFITNYAKYIVNRIIKNFGSGFQLIFIFVNIAFKIINIEKEKEENLSIIMCILFIILKGNFKNLLLGEFCNLNSEEKEVAKKEIELICKMEKENKNIKCKVLNNLFYGKLEEAFKMYLNDGLYIKNGEGNCYLKEFYTFKDDFYIFKPEKRQNIKKCACFLLGCEITNKGQSSEEDKNKTQQIAINHYNSRRAIINNAISSFFSVIKDYALHKYGIELYTPTLKNKLEKNVDQYETVFTQKLKFIFDDLVPRRNKEGKNYSERIDEVLKQEEKEDEKNRILTQLLNLVDIKNYLRAYINDENIIKIKDNKGNEFNLYLPNLKTFRDNFDLPEEKKVDYRLDFIDLLDRKVKGRNSSELRNSKLKNNKNLTGRKRKNSN